MCLVNGHSKIVKLMGVGIFVHWLDECFYVLVRLAAVRKRSGVRRLVSAHLSADVFSLTMGLPREHTIDEGYARCRLCCKDVLIDGRGQTAWKAHWHSPKHYALEYRYRVRRRLPLYARNFQVKNPGKGKQLDLLDPEDVRADELRPTLGDVFLEAGDSMTLPERQERDRTSTPLTEQGRLDRLWTAALVDGLVHSLNFDGVCHALETRACSVALGVDDACFMPYTVDNVKVSLFLFLSPRS